MSTTELLTLFDQLCELEPQQRAAELARLSARAPELGKQLQAMRGADAQDTELLARDIEQQAPLQLQQAQNVQAWRWMARRISQLSMSMACRFWTLCALTVGACGALKPVASVSVAESLAFDPAQTERFFKP